MHVLLSQLDEKSLLYDLLDNNAVYDVNRANGGRAVDLGVAVRFSDIRVDMSEQKGPPLSFVFANGLYITSDIADEPESRKDRIIGDLTGKYPRNKIQRFPDVKSQYHPDANEFSFINLSREKPEEILEPFPTISGDDAMALLDELFQLIPLPQR